MLQSLATIRLQAAAVLSRLYLPGRAESFDPENTDRDGVQPVHLRPVSIAEATASMARAGALLCAKRAVNRLKWHLGLRAQDHYRVTRDPDQLGSLIRQAASLNKRIIVFAGCGVEAKEVIEAAQRPKNRNALVVGIEPTQFDFKPTRRELPNAVFFQGTWQSAFHKIQKDPGVMDEINFVAPSGSSDDIFATMAASSIIFFSSSFLAMIDKEGGDYQELYDRLKTGGSIQIYTENARWARDFKEALEEVFGKDHVTMTEVSSDWAPLSSILQRHPKIYYLYCNQKIVMSEKARTSLTVAPATHRSPIQSQRCW